MNGDKAAKGATKEGMQVKRSDPGWYKEVLTKAELIEYYDIKVRIKRLNLSWLEGQGGRSTQIPVHQARAF